MPYEFSVERAIGLCAEPYECQAALAQTFGEGAEMRPYLVPAGRARPRVQQHEFAIVQGVGAPPLRHPCDLVLGTRQVRTRRDVVDAGASEYLLHTFEDVTLAAPGLRGMMRIWVSGVVSDTFAAAGKRAQQAASVVTL